MPLGNLRSFDKFLIPCIIVVPFHASPHVTHFLTLLPVHSATQCHVPISLTTIDIQYQPPGYQQFQPIPSTVPPPLLCETGNTHHCLKSDRISLFFPLLVQREMIQVTDPNLFERTMLGFASNKLCKTQEI